LSYHLRASHDGKFPDLSSKASTVQSNSVFNKSMKSKAATTTKSKKSRKSVKPMVTEPELEVVDIISPRKEMKDDDS